MSWVSKPPARQGGPCRRAIHVRDVSRHRAVGGELLWPMLHSCHWLVRTRRGCRSTVVIACATSSGSRWSSSAGSPSVRPAPMANSVCTPAGQIDPDAFGADLTIERPGQADLSELGRGVDGFVGAAAKAGHRADDDDVAASLRDAAELSHGRARGPYGAFDVRPHHRLEVIVAAVEDAAIHADASLTTMLSNWPKRSTARSTNSAQWHSADHERHRSPRAG